MASRVTVSALVVSVSLNLAFAGAYVAHRLALVADPPGMPAPAAVPVYEQLELTLEQRESFLGHREQFIRLLERLSGALQERQVELLDLIAAAPPHDFDAIELVEGEIQGLQGEIQSAVVEHLLAESLVLDPRQRARWVSLVKERMAGIGGPPPPWMGSGAPAHRSPWARSTRGPERAVEEEP